MISPSSNRNSMVALVLCTLSFAALWVGCGQSPEPANPQSQFEAEALRQVAAMKKAADEAAKNGTQETGNVANRYGNNASPSAFTGGAAKGARAAMSFEFGYDRPASPERQGMSSQQIADVILKGENVTPQDFVDFVRACPNSPPGRELLVQVAARGAELLPPNDYSLIHIATGLLEYGLENPDAPELEATVGLVEAIADAEEDRYGSESGDAVYVGFAEKLTHAPAVYMTGNVRLNLLGQLDKVNHYFVNRQNQDNLFLRHLDYERLVRGFKARLAADPENLSLSASAVIFGYQTRNKDLARVGARFFDNHPEYASQPERQGDFWAHLDWAKAP